MVNRRQHPVLLLDGLRYVTDYTAFRNDANVCCLDGCSAPSARNFIPFIAKIMRYDGDCGRFLLPRFFLI